MTTADKNKIQPILNKVTSLQESRTISTDHYAQLHTIACKLVEMGAEI